MWSPKWDRRRQRASEDTTSCGIHGGSGRIIPSPIRSSDIGAGTLGGRRGCSIPLPSRDVQHPIGWLMTPNCVRSQDRLPAWQAGADPAALRPLGTKPFVCWRLGIVANSRLAHRRSVRFLPDSGILGPMDVDSLQGQEGGIVRSWLDLRDFLP